MSSVKAGVQIVKNKIVNFFFCNFIHLANMMYFIRNTCLESNVIIEKKYIYSFDKKKQILFNCSENLTINQVPVLFSVKMS